MSLINYIVAIDSSASGFNHRVLYALLCLVLMHLAIKCASLIVRTKTNEIAICQNTCSQELSSLHFSTLLAFILLPLDSFTSHIYFWH
jgi:hypothetical protein